MAVTTEEILQRLNNLQSVRSPWTELWSGIQNYISPYILDLAGKSKSRIAINNKLYDGRPVTASRIFANGFTGNIVPRGAPWFGLKTSSQEKNRSTRVKQFLKGMEGYYYERFETSDFYESMFPFVRTAADYGTAAMYLSINPKTNVLQFQNLPLGTYFIDEDEFGDVDTLYRVFRMQNRNILKKWPDVDEKTKSELKGALYNFTEVIHAVQPREDYKHGDVSNKNMPWSSVYMLKGGQDGVILSESGFQSFPYIVWRYTQESGFPYGVGPGIESARDAQILQQVAKTTTSAGHKAVDPPMAIDENMIGTEELFPGGRNYMRSGWVDPHPIQSSISYPIGKDREDQLRRAIDEHYSVDFFLMLAQADRQMTAQEVIERQAEKSAVLSTIIGRFNSEVLDRIFDRVWELDMEAGLIQLNPDDQEVMGSDISVDYTGPLAQVQKRYHQTAGLQQFLNGTLPLAQFNPAVLDMFDFDKIVEAQGDAYNIAPGVLRDEKDLKKLRDAKAAAQAQAMQKAQADQALEQMTNAAQKANAPVQPGSPLEAMLGGPK